MAFHLVPRPWSRSRPKKGTSPERTGPLSLNGRALAAKCGVQPARTIVGPLCRERARGPEAKKSPGVGATLGARLLSIYPAADALRCLAQGHCQCGSAAQRGKEETRYVGVQDLYRHKPSNRRATWV
jgi:hypothetical protein